MRKLHKYYKILELDKILDQLAEMTCCEEAAEMARNILPFNRLDKVKAELAKTDGAYVLSSRFGTPNFIRFKIQRLT